MGAGAILGLAFLGVIVYAILGWIGVIRIPGFNA